MKQCPNCGAQIADDSRFCAECGKEIPQGTACPHCGASISEGDAFCQNCGKNLKEVFTNEPITYEEERPKRGFKKYLPYILGAFVLLVIIGYYNAKDSNGKNDTQTAVSDTLSVNNGFATEDNHSSKDFIMKRLDDIFDDVVKGNIIGSDDGYFTKEFVSLYNQVDKIDESADGIGFWDGGFWGQQFDETIKKVEVNKIFDITENKAKVSVVFRVFADGHTMAIPDTLGLVYERDDWYIDELHHYKRDMKAYIQSNPQSDTEGNQVGNSYSKYVGRWILRKMTDGGNRMRIEITLKDNKSGENVVFAEHGSHDEVLVYEEYQQCILNDGIIYMTKDGDINGKGVPKLRVGSDGLYSFSGEKYTRKLE